jgi:DNA repair protein RadC
MELQPMVYVREVDLVYRTAVKSRTPEMTPGTRITRSRDLFQIFREFFCRQTEEVFVLLPLNGKNQIMAGRKPGFFEVSRGSVTSSIVHPREVFKRLILANAVSFIVMHNHPSGDPMPSTEDVEITRRLKSCAELVGIRVLDHVVMGTEGYVSFADQGIL